MDQMLTEMRAALTPEPPETGLACALTASDQEAPSWFQVSDLASASIAAAGLALAQYAGARGPLGVDQRKACLWFGMTLQPIGWSLPSIWDAVAGDYQTADGWIRLHTNAPHHRAAALGVLDAPEDRAAVAATVKTWSAAALEQAVVEAGGCAAEMRSLEAWRAHPQGASVGAEPLIHWERAAPVSPTEPDSRPERPLAGVKVLDLTRVLAGPIAGRFLAAYGADVLRIDPPEWDEPAVVPEVTLGKRCAGLDLRESADRAVFDRLVAEADLLLHGYRPTALAGLGYDSAALRRLNPGLVDVSLCAYGWTGPWKGRRGFDSLVQMSCGIAAHGMTASGAEKPTPLPFQALDHATGYLIAAAALTGLSARARRGEVWSGKLSLARTAELLAPTARGETGLGIAPLDDADLAPSIEKTDWGPARRVVFPLTLAGAPAAWEHPATGLRSAEPRWNT